MFTDTEIFPPQCKGIYFYKFDDGRNKPEITEIEYRFTERDDGKTWKKRSTIGKYDKASVPDGHMEENSLAIASNGDILCVMRTEICIDTEINNTVCDAITICWAEIDIM